jgi:2-polyprenyl-3-methyl-5-hydroxy-6-metoxy-1,4-benzoquinol methylase
LNHSEDRLTSPEKRIYDRYISALNVSSDLIGPRTASLARTIRRHFPPDRGAEILDIACGSGALIFLARRLGYRNIRGVDISPEQIALAKRLGIVGVDLADGIEILRSAVSASFDALVSYDILEHLDKGTVLEVATQAHRVLRPEGRWLIHAPNGESPFCGAIRYGDLTHQLAFTRSSMTQLLRLAGFTKMTFHEDSPGIHGPKSLIRWLGWKAIALILNACTLFETGERDAVMSRSFLTVAYRE